MLPMIDTAGIEVAAVAAMGLLATAALTTIGLELPMPLLELSLLFSEMSYDVETSVGSFGENSDDNCWLIMLAVPGRFSILRTIKHKSVTY